MLQGSLKSDKSYQFWLFTIKVLLCTLYNANCNLPDFTNIMVTVIIVLSL